jgi:hypothetical protein
MPASSAQVTTNEGHGTPLDGLAMAISGLCAVHCLALPLILSLSPFLSGTILGSDDFHRWLLMLVLPLSLVAFGRGYRWHRDRQIWTPGIIGLLLLIGSALFGVEILTEWGERAMTVVGGMTLAWAHYLNYRLNSHSDHD